MLAFCATQEIEGEIVAPCVFDGPIDAASFTAWVEQSLVPTIKPGDVVVLDNLASHEDPRAQSAVQAAGAHRLFLPPPVPFLAVRSVAFEAARIEPTGREPPSTP